MRPLRKPMLVGAAAIVLVAGLAVAEIKNDHVLDVRLPDGALAHIRYAGDTPPMVSFAPAPMALSILAPASDPFGPGSGFAALARISQAMDRQADEMLREAGVPPGPSAGLDLLPVEAATPPPGARAFAVVSTLSDAGRCTRSVAYRERGDGKPPEVVTHTFGACAADETRSAPSARSRPAAAAARPDPAGRTPI